MLNVVLPLLTAVTLDTATVQPQVVTYEGQPKCEVAVMSSRNLMEMTSTIVRALYRERGCKFGTNEFIYSVERMGDLITLTLKESR